jgi:hypothetical protein
MEGRVWHATETRGWQDKSVIDQNILTTYFSTLHQKQGI